MIVEYEPIDFPNPYFFIFLNHLINVRKIEFISHVHIIIFNYISIRFLL